MALLSRLLPVAALALASCESADKTYDPLPQVETSQTDIRCTPTREYVTVYRYLQDTDALKLSETESRRIALSIVDGCRGAAQRFVNTATLLLRSRLDGRSAVKVATEAALLGEDEGQAFATIFKYSFLKQHLDMTLREAVETARMLSIDFSGRARDAEEDFSKLTEFCMAPEELNLVRPTCVKLATTVTKMGGEHKTKMADAFIRAANFLMKSTEGPKFSKQQTVEVATQLMRVSPFAGKNYRQAFVFAMSKDGHKLSKKDAHKLATRLASHTAKKLDSPKERS